MGFPIVFRLKTVIFRVYPGHIRPEVLILHTWVDRDLALSPGYVFVYIYIYIYIWIYYIYVLVYYGWMGSIWFNHGHFEVPVCVSNFQPNPNAPCLRVIFHSLHTFTSEIFIWMINPYYSTMFTTKTLMFERKILQGSNGSQKSKPFDLIPDYFLGFSSDWGFSQLCCEHQGFPGLRPFFHSAARHFPMRSRPLRDRPRHLGAVRPDVAWPTAPKLGIWGILVSIWIIYG